MSTSSAIKVLERRMDRLKQDIASATGPRDKNRLSYLKAEFWALAIALEALDERMLTERMEQADRNAATQRQIEASC